MADFRAIYTVSVWDVRGPELIFLIRDLLKNPASRFHAAVADWDFPVTRHELYMLDLIDVLMFRWRRDKHTPLPRPWSKKKTRKKRRTAEEALRILRPHRTT